MTTHYLSYGGKLPNHEAKYAAAIGDFDGVHLGHRQVIGRAVQLADQKGLKSAVMTFCPHPREVLGHKQYSRSLAPFSKKSQLLKQLGVDDIWAVRFDEEFSKVEPEQFFENMLALLNIDTIVVGFDFTFGHRGRGTPDLLKELGKGNINVEVVPPYKIDGEKVSSTCIRELLLEGEVELANKYLGRRYAVSGTVVEGEKRGRTIGFPTANIALDDSYVIPAKGVYAVNVACQGQKHHGVMNIGVKPTFHGDLDVEPTLEVHILDFDRSIYGEAVEVEFVKFIRKEQKFGSVEALIKQIAQDAETARACFASLD